MRFFLVAMPYFGPHLMFGVRVQIYLVLEREVFGPKRCDATLTPKHRFAFADIIFRIDAAMILSWLQLKSESNGETERMAGK